MNSKTLCAIGGLALAQSVPAIAQEDAASQIDGSVIEAHSASFDITYRAADGTETDGGHWTDAVSIDDDKLVRTVVRYNPEGKQDLVRTVVADRVTLMPSVMDQRFGPGLSGVMHVNYAGDTADQMLIRAPQLPMQRIDAQFGKDVWELSLWGTLAMSLPFEEGRTFTLPTISADRQSVRDVNFVVEGVETIEFAASEYEAAKISIPEENWTFWVRKEAPYVLRIEHPAPGGLIAISTLEETE